MVSLSCQVPHLFSFQQCMIIGKTLILFKEFWHFCIWHSFSVQKIYSVWTFCKVFINCPLFDSSSRSSRFISWWRMHVCLHTFAVTPRCGCIRQQSMCDRCVTCFRWLTVCRWWFVSCSGHRRLRMGCNHIRWFDDKWILRAGGLHPVSEQTFSFTLTLAWPQLWNTGRFLKRLF